LPSGGWAVWRERGAIFLAGEGATADGDRPFLDRLELATLKSERLFRADRTSLERFEGWLDPARGMVFTLRQSPSQPPNLMLRTLGAAAPKPGAGEANRMSDARKLTAFTDPTPQFHAVTKRLVTFPRADGVQVSFTLYLPPDYKPGTRLPTVFWAYPLEYSDPATAGQVTAAPNAFTFPSGSSPVFLALAGY